jgi:hypothetical protein
VSTITRILDYSGDNINSKLVQTHVAGCRTGAGREETISFHSKKQNAALREETVPLHPKTIGGSPKAAVRSLGDEVDHYTHVSQTSYCRRARDGHSHLANQPFTRLEGLTRIPGAARKTCTCVMLRTLYVLLPSTLEDSPKNAGYTDLYQRVSMLYN